MGIQHERDREERPGGGPSHAWPPELLEGVIAENHTATDGVEGRRPVQGAVRTHSTRPNLELQLQTVITEETSDDPLPFPKTHPSLAMPKNTGESVM